MGFAVEETKWTEKEGREGKSGQRDGVGGERERGKKLDGDDGRQCW